MGQKINPTGLRIGVIKDWESRWYAKKADFGDTLVEDYELREYLLETLAPAVDFADLDGNLLISNDLFRGMEVVNGKITLSDRPGIGLELL